MKTLLNVLSLCGLVAVGGCGATLGDACENSVNLCFADFVDDVDAAVDDCVEAGADDDALDADAIKCVAKAETCEAILLCAPAGDTDDTDDTDDVP